MPSDILIPENWRMTNGALVEQLKKYPIDKAVVLSIGFQHYYVSRLEVNETDGVLEIQGYPVAPNDEES